MGMEMVCPVWPVMHTKCNCQSLSSVHGTSDKPKATYLLHTLVLFNHAQIYTPHVHVCLLFSLTTFNVLLMVLEYNMSCASSPKI